MKVASTSGLVFNWRKCQINNPISLFMELFSTEQAWNLNLRRYKESQKCPPSNIQKLQSFLGMLNFMQPYIPHLSHHTISPKRIIEEINNNHCIPEAQIFHHQDWLLHFAVLPERILHHSPGICKQTQHACLLITTQLAYCLHLKVPERWWHLVGKHWMGVAGHHLWLWVLPQIPLCMLLYHQDRPQASGDDSPEECNCWTYSPARNAYNNMR